jgi:chromosomal replication initiation ATPase DnaA
MLYICRIFVEMKKNKKPLIHPYTYVGIKYGEVMNKIKEKKNLQERISKSPSPNILKDVILKIVSDECGAKMEDIISSKRTIMVVDARYVYIAALRIKYNLGLNEIGKLTYNRDHSSIIHALKTFDNRYETELAFKNKANSVFYMLNIEYTHRFYPPKS